jgi:glyoxylase-like metal-dependent hydrolase (beta-lactamase superfamily II)
LAREQQVTTFSFGDVTATRIEESLVPVFNPTSFIPDFDFAAVEPHMDWFAPNHFDPVTGRLVISMHSWLIRTPQHTILIDTCVGDHTHMPALPAYHMKEFPWLKNLAAAGVQPEEVDFVLCTHLHSDHVGWNTRLEDGRHVPTFPNARYVMSKAEYDHHASSDEASDNNGAFRNRVLPVVDAGLSELVSGDHSIGDSLVITPAPGHTPGHVAITLNNAGENGLFIGDALHSAIQGVFPDWNSAFCQDPDAARATRRRLLEHCCEHDALLMPQHFGIPFATKVRPKGNAFTFDFMS